MIQETGGLVIVYSAGLWDDKSVLLGLMRKDNLDAEISKEETELGT